MIRLTTHRDRLALLEAVFRHLPEDAADEVIRFACGLVDARTVDRAHADASRRRREESWEAAQIGGTR